jgi:hypothetical protein
MESFLRGHVGAFTAWGGVPRVLLYDNLKSAVLERRGDAIRFHPSLLAFAGRYRFEPRPVAVARGNEKGRVERAIGYVRTAFFAARRFTDLDDLNAQSLPLRRRGPMAGAMALLPIGGVRASPAARCATCLPRKHRACCHCPTTLRRCSNVSRSRPARHPTSAST